MDSTWCQICGEEGFGIVPIAKGFQAHVRCFVVHNVFHVLNHGREFKCPAGQWSVNWMNELVKHCRPEIGEHVRQLMALMLRTGVDPNALTVSSKQCLNMLHANKTSEQDLMQYLCSVDAIGDCQATRN